MKSASRQPAAAPARAIVEHLVLGQERALPAPRRSGERAVAADVAAQRRQRDEDLRRVGDERAGAQPARLGEQLLERCCEKIGDHASIVARESVVTTTGRGGLR